MAETGRVNQKRRTRQAIIDAAQRLLADGKAPTVAEAAEAAEVGRTTAYRYFPSQESLLTELTVTEAVTQIEELAARPADARTGPDRLVELLLAFDRHVLDEQVRYRTAMRLYQDQWLAAHEAGDDAPVVREGRRRRWFAQVLGPAMDEAGLTKRERERLVAALAPFAGGEWMSAMRDVCGLDDEVALEVTEWAARALLRAALEER